MLYSKLLLMGHTIPLHWLSRGGEVTNDVTCPLWSKVMPVKFVSEYCLILCMAEEEWGEGGRVQER